MNNAMHLSIFKAPDDSCLLFKYDFMQENANTEAFWKKNLILVYMAWCIFIDFLREF